MHVGLLLFPPAGSHADAARMVEQLADLGLDFVRVVGGSRDMPYLN